MYLHHIGYVVKNIEKYEQHLLYKRKLKEVADPLQNARLALYETWSESRLELIEPLDESAFTHSFLQKNGNAYHHLCYSVESVDAMQEIAAAKGLLLFKGPLEAPLFDGLEVYFFFDRNKSITEFLIEPPQNEQQ